MAARKQPFSIWTKMERKSVGFEQLSDIFGFRVVVNDVEDCYRALGVVHTTWPVVPGRFKDYISTPKQNDYRSIHTTVIGPGNQRVELQIRTEEMHQIAEFGIAAHAFYKDGVGSPTELLEARVQRLRLAAPHHRHPVGERQSGRIPRAHQARAVPRPGVLLHPEGQADRAAAPRQRDRLRLCRAHRRRQQRGRLQDQRPVRAAVSELQNGDEVEVLTSEAQSAPPSAWESLAVTGKARAAIRRATRTAVRDQYAGLGRRIVERLFERAKIEYADDKLKGALPRLARASIEDVMAAVGRGEIKASDVARAMYPDYKEERVARYGAKKGARRQAQGEVAAEPSRSPVAIPDPRHQFRPAGEVRAERRRRAWRPHRRHRHAGRGHHHLSDPVAGAEGFRGGAGALARRALGHRGFRRRSASRRASRSSNVNEPGALAQIATVIAEHDGNIDNISMQRRSPDFTETTIDLEVYDLKHLSAILAQLRAKAVVARVERVNG